MTKKNIKVRVKKKDNSNREKIKPGYYVFLLGVAFLVSIIFMGVIFFNERVGLSPFFNISFMDGFTEGENWFLAMISIIFATFFGLLVISIIFKKSQTRVI